jgi:hypothetical protein
MVRHRISGAGPSKCAHHVLALVVWAKLQGKAGHRLRETLNPKP